MGLIVMSDLFCFDVVVRHMGANEPDINNLKFVLHGYNQPIRIPLDVEYDTVVAKNARRAVRGLDILRASPLALLARYTMLFRDSRHPDASPKRTSVSLPRSEE